MKKTFVFCLGLFFPFLVLAGDLKDGVTLSKNTKYSLQFHEQGREQFLTSVEVNSKKVIKKTVVWSGIGDGSLLNVGEKLKSGPTNILVLEGTDGDDSFFQIVGWNDVTGDISHLMGGYNFDTQLKLKSPNQLDIFLKEGESENFGSINSIPKKRSKSCSEKIDEMEKIKKEINGITMKMGNIPNAKDSDRLNQLELKKQKIIPTELHFDLEDFNQIMVQCK